MSDKDERNLKLLDSVKTDVQTETAEKVSRQTNPLVKKFLAFQNNKTEKFGVKDLFRK